VATTIYTLTDYGNRISEKRFLGSKVVQVNPEGFDDVPDHLTGWLKASWCVNRAIHEREDIGDYDLIEHIDFGALAYFFIKEELQKGRQLPLICSSVNPSFNTNMADGRSSYSLPEYILGEAERFVLLASREVWTPTNAALFELRSRLPQLSSTSVILQPLPRICCIEERKPFESRTIDLLFFGRQQTIKGFDLFVRSLSIIWERNPRILEKKKVAVLGQEHIIFPQVISSTEYAQQILGEKFKELLFFGLKEDVCDVLNEAKNVCCPSRSDYGPYTVIESLQHNVNLVIPAAGAGSEISSLLGLADRTFQFQNQDTYSLADAIEAALSQTSKITVDYSIDEVWNNKREKLDQENLEKRLAFAQLVHEPLRQYPGMINASLSRAGLSVKSVDVLDISAVIPLYNQSHYLTDSITSLINAGLRPKNIFVIDDGSTKQQSQAAEEICQRFQVSYFFWSNRGLSAARNKGLSFVTNEFVIFLDADDQIEPSYPFKAINILENFTNVAAVGAWIRLFGEQSTLLPTWDANSAMYFYKNTLNSAGLVWRTSAIRSINGFSEEFLHGYEDYEACAKILRHGWVIPVIDEALFKYRIRHDSMFKSISLESHRTNYKAILSDIDALSAKEVIALIISNGNPLNRTSIFFGSSPGAILLSNKPDKWVLLKHLHNNSRFIRRIWRRMPSGVRSYFLRKLLSALD
jgi:glycosyltransferase involved in cell wall biosynthesis